MYKHLTSSANLESSNHLVV